MAELTQVTKMRTGYRKRTLQLVSLAAMSLSAEAFSNPMSLIARMARDIGRTTSLSMIDQGLDKKNTQFDLELGKAMDTLKSDYPYIMRSCPDFSIYDTNLEAVDPSGFKIHGITNYKRAFNLIHAITNVFYCPDKSLLTFRLVYDCVHNNIRVSWNAEVIPKAIFGGTKTPLHVDGISVYELNSDGKVSQHRVEHLTINDMPVETERGIFAALRDECPDMDGIPVFARGSDPFIANFQTPPQIGKSISLFSKDDESLTLNAVSTSSGSAEGDTQYPGLDWDALDRKNKSRKKFGLAPLSPEEFLEIEAQVRQMELQQAANAPKSSNRDAAEVPRDKNVQKGGFLSNIFGEVFEDTCESNFDCVRPEVCCDFGFKKMCCSSGAMVGSEQMQPLRIPVTKDDGYMNGY